MEGVCRKECWVVFKQLCNSVQYFSLQALLGSYESGSRSYDVMRVGVIKSAPCQFGFGYRRERNKTKSDVCT